MAQAMFAFVSLLLFGCGPPESAGRTFELRAVANAVAGACVRGGEAAAIQDWVLLANQSLELFDLGNPVREADGSMQFRLLDSRQGYKISFSYSRDFEADLHRYELEYDLDVQVNLKNYARGLRLSMVVYLGENGVHSFHVLANHEVHNTAPLGEFFAAMDSHVLRSGGSYKVYPDRVVWHSVDVRMSGVGEELPVMTVGVGDLESRESVRFDFDQMALLESTLIAIR